MRLFDKYRETRGTQSSLYEDTDLALSLDAIITSWVDIVKSGGSVKEQDMLDLLAVVKSYYESVTESDSLFEDTEAILFKKTQDYNAERVNEPGFKLDDQRSEYFPFGPQSYIHMIYTKVLRIRNIATTGHTANFEGIKDSLIDCAAYLSFFYSSKVDSI